MGLLIAPSSSNDLKMTIRSSFGSEIDLHAGLTSSPLIASCRSRPSRAQRAPQPQGKRAQRISLQKQDHY